jgi:hypothetical protein
MWVCSHKMWNPASLTMDTKASWMALWDAILSPPWVQWRRWIPMGFNRWPQMQCVKPKTKGWGRPNMVHNTQEKTFEGKWKHEMIRWANSQASVLSLAHDSSWCESKDMSKMMLEKEWSCSSLLYKLFKWG